MKKLIIALGFGFITAVASITGASAAKVEDVVSACDKMNDAKDGSCSMKIKGNGMEVCTSNGCAYCPADGSRTCSKAARGGNGPGRGVGGVVNSRGFASGVDGGTSPTQGRSQLAAGGTEEARRGFRSPLALYSLVRHSDLKARSAA